MEELLYCTWYYLYVPVGNSYLCEGSLSLLFSSPQTWGMAPDRDNGPGQHAKETADGEEAHTSVFDQVAL